ncbi:akirin-2 isoform X1 [Ictalurus furcatus]|uniref:akirin-2 isoform X1 n=1 Tax=Ictalurus furcatus TaxID=66913 RepID=UPI002350DE2A|nr:akirin-2 isoform X1 [Ictalurus furcatus]
MACGATLKRTMDFDPLLSPGSSKRRRCAPVSQSSAPRNYLRHEPSPFSQLSVTLTTEQILNNIKQEYKRMQKRKHLDGSLHQPEVCSSFMSQSQTSLLSGSSYQEATVERKNSLRRYEGETLRGTRLKREPVLTWVTPDSVIINKLHHEDASAATACNVQFMRTPTRSRASGWIRQVRRAELVRITGL